MAARYQGESGPLRYAPLYIWATILGLGSLAATVIFAILSAVLALRGGDGWAVALNAGLSNTLGKGAGLFFVLALALLAAAVILYRKTSSSAKIAALVRYGLFNSGHGNPLHLRDGELLPRISCKRIAQGLYELTVSAHESV